MKQSSTLERRMAAVLSADLVDYTRHVAERPDDMVAAMALLHDLVGAEVSRQEGIVVDFVGDNFLAVFDDPTSALTAAISICEDVRNRNADVPEDHRIRFRMGFDFGEVISTPDGRFLGDPINVAARVQAIANPGCITVSERVFVALDRPELRFASMGQRRLKNVPEAIGVYALEGFDDVPSGRSPARHGRLSVAVIPFVGSSPGALEAAEAIRFDVMAGLGLIPMLDVIDGSPSHSGLARSDTRYVLEGGVVRSGEQLRAYVQLLETDTMNRVWAHRWEGSIDELFALQDTITSDVQRAIEIDLVVGEPARLYRTISDPRSIESVYKGWFHLAQGSQASWMKANHEFEQVVLSSPESTVGPALAAFSRWYGAMNGLSADPRSDFVRAGEYAKAGIELDDPTGLSHMVLAALTIFDGGDLEHALSTAREAAVRRPTCDVTFGVEASIERYLGRWEEGMAAAKRAIDLSPVIEPWYSTILAGCLYIGERYREAADEAEGLVEFDEANLDAHLVLVAARQALGQERRAAGAADLTRRRFPKFSVERLASIHPFVDQSVLDRWRSHLLAAGLD